MLMLQSLYWLSQLPGSCSPLLCSALSWHPTVSGTFLALGWHLCQNPKKASAWTCSHQESQPPSAAMGCHRNPCGVNFYFVIIIGFLSVFYAQPKTSDWQIHCLIFLGLDYMLFSSKPSSFINLHSFLILMHRSIIISLDSFWQSAATFSCLAWI